MDAHDVFVGISGGRVLDVATGRGGFAVELAEGLKDYAEIIGVDSNPAHERAFLQSAAGRTGFLFKVMDANRLDFADRTFDTVCVSNSLHHFEHSEIVLQEMLRVLHPGGRMIVAEMYRDRQTDTQMTHVLLHHWWAAIDQLQGIIHRETYSRNKLIELVKQCGVSSLEAHDQKTLDEDPLDAELLAELDQIIDSYIQKAEEHPDLQARGEELRRRVHSIGYHSATRLLIIAHKSPQDLF